MTVRSEILKDLKKIIEKLGLPTDIVSLDRPQSPTYGDYCSNYPLQSQKIAIQKGWQSPLETANKIVARLKGQVSNGEIGYLEKIEVAKPGFINFFLSNDFLQDQIREIVGNREKFGQVRIGKGKKARVEFVSANPTGPLHIGNARGGPIGDAIANVLSAAGFAVLREYFHNDVGGQVEKFAQSLFGLISGKKLENGQYKAPYMAELAKKIKAESIKEAQKAGTKLILEEILEDCQLMGIRFDKVYREGEIVNSGRTRKIVEILKKKGVAKEQEGALWFAPEDEFLKDRESVLVKGDGTFTYFANDLAYHDLKFSQGADLVVDEFGAGHHGHVPRLKAGIAALGHNLSKIHFVLHQNVRVKRGKEVVRMSKRAGNIVTARQVLEEVGKDPFRFFMLLYDSNSHIDFDLTLAKKKSKENPVYYVQYAHARICSILRKANSDLRLKTSRRRQSSYGASAADLRLLDHPAELALIRKLIQLPELVEDFPGNFAVHRLAFYAVETADLFHKFYEQCQVLATDSQLRQARLQLVASAGIIIRSTLKLLGVSAPEKM